MSYLTQRRKDAKINALVVRRALTVEIGYSRELRGKDTFKGRAIEAEVEVRR